MGVNGTVAQDEQRLQELLAVKARWLREEKLRYYKPHRKQLEFHKSQAEKRGVFGGNQSGKSYSGGNEVAMTVGKVHPFRPNYSGPVYARDCCKSFQVLNSVLIPTYKSLLPRRECKLDGYFYEIAGQRFEMPDCTYEGRPRIWPGLKGGTWDSAYNKEFRILYLEDGSFIEFKTYEQDVDSFAGPPRHIIRHDEEPPQAIYNENQARQVTIAVNMLFTMTPLNYSQWLYADIYEKSLIDPKIECFKMGIAENPFANPDVIAAMENDITDPAERAARLYGEFTYLEGLVWKEYGDHNYIDPLPINNDWHKTVVIDPHLEKPTAVNWFAEDYSGRLICYREADLKGDVEHICTQIDVMGDGEHIDTYLIDPSARQSASIRGQGRLIDEFRKYFPYIIEANNNKELGIEVVRQFVKQKSNLEGAKLLISKACPVTHSQMRNLSWKPPTKTGEDRRKPEVVKRNDDHPDCVRYRCMYRRTGRKKDFSGFKIGVYGRG